MSRSLILSLLRSGNNGEQILQILDTIVSDIQGENDEPAAEEYGTLNPIQF